MTTKSTIGLVVILMLATLGGVGWYFNYLSRCLASGGGTGFEPPAAMAQNEPLLLELTLNRWGHNSCIDKKYWVKDSPRNIFTDVQCHYRVSGDEDYTPQKMQLVMESTDDASYLATYRCVVPPQTGKAGSQLEYFFDYRWPDDLHKLEQPPLPIR